MNFYFLIYFFTLLEFRFDETFLRKSRVRERRIVKNLRCYYNFFNDENFQFKSRIISEHDKSILVKFSDSYDYVENDIDIGPEKKIVKELVDFAYLMQKTKITQELLLKTKHMEHLKQKKTNFCTRINSKCKECNASCNFTISELYDSFSRIKVQDLKQELKRHKHPMSRVINKKQNNKEQKRDELVNHYKNIHRS